MRGPSGYWCRARRRTRYSTHKKKNDNVFDIQLGLAGDVTMTGRLDASQCEAALRFLEAVAEPRVIDLAGLEYIASSGLRVFLLTQKRLRSTGASLRLINVRPPIRDIFRYAGFDQILDIAEAAP